MNLASPSSPRRKLRRPLTIGQRKLSAELYGRQASDAARKGGVARAAYYARRAATHALHVLGRA